MIFCVKRCCLLLSLSLIICGGLSAQPFIGLPSADNTIMLVPENPAFAVHEDVIQANIASVGGIVGGNSFAFNPGVYNFFNTGNSLSNNVDYVKQYGGARKDFNATIDIMGPGASFKIKKKYNVAVTTGMRYLLNSDNLSTDVFAVLGANPRYEAVPIDTHLIHNYSLVAQVFSQVGFTYGGYLYNSQEQTLKGGVTLKILVGAGAVGLGIPTASFATHNNDGNTYTLAGNANIAFTPYANKWAITTNPFNAFSQASFNGGVGFDMGLVYEIHKPENYRLQKKYTVRLAISITDIGGIGYTASSTTGSYSASIKDTVRNQPLSYNIQNNSSVTFGSILNTYTKDSVLTQTSSKSKFRVGLPTALRLNGDMKIDEDFYINANALINLRSPSADKYVNHYITGITITPRYMHNGFGIGLPFSYNKAAQTYIGAVIFMGPFYIGVPTIYNMLVTRDAISAYAGLSFRIKSKEDAP